MRFLLMATLCSISMIGICLAPAQFMFPDNKADAQTEVVEQAIPLEEGSNSIDPYEPVEIIVINNTSLELFAGISGGTRVELPSQETIIVHFDATPINVFIYPASPGSTLKFNTNFEDNVVTVEVTQIEDVAPGYRAITIEPSGNAYIF